MVVSLDKEVAVNSEKQSSIYIQLDRLDEKIKELTNNTVVKDTRKKDTTEKVLLLVLGSIITFIFNKFS
ncbi:hemolysin [Staphylococcus phage Koomba-kaat_1]|nr:hemolysin [Staphylococcus phage Koomba-kaat_1]